MVGLVADRNGDQPGPGRKFDSVVRCLAGKEWEKGINNIPFFVTTGNGTRFSVTILSFLRVMPIGPRSATQSGVLSFLGSPDDDPPPC